MFMVYFHIPENEFTTLNTVLVCILHCFLYRWGFVTHGGIDGVQSQNYVPEVQYKQ